MTEATQIGSALPDLKILVATDSPAPLTSWTEPCPAETMAMLRALPDRLADADLVLVESIARLPIPALPIATPKHLVSCLRSLSILPRRSDDDSTGEHRVKIFGRMFGHLSADELSFMTRAALERCRWFPTPAECLDILTEWRRGGEDLRIRELARGISNAERSKRYAELRTRVDLARSGIGDFTHEDLEALSNHQRGSLERDCLIWSMLSGRWRLRNQQWSQAVADDALVDDQREASGVTVQETYDTPNNSTGN